jgi:multidrug efflux system membrane fusion protein
MKKQTMMIAPRVFSPRFSAPCVSLWRSGLSALGAALVVSGLAACSKQEAPPPIERAARTLVVSGQGGDIEREYSAEVRARVESRLSFRVPGKVIQRQVELGQTVRAGQSLAQLDAQDLKLQQAAAQAGLAAAEANARQATADLERFKELKAQSFISEAEYDRHVTAHLSAEAALRQAKAQAGVQGNQTGYAGLLAGANGVVTQLDLESGQVVAAGQPVLTLAHDGPRDVVFSVPEDMGPHVRGMVGKAGGLKVRRWASPDWLPATVREVAAAADPVSRTLLVKADIGVSSFELGQTATVVFSTPVRHPQGILIPLSALAERDGQSVVWVLDPKTMTVRPTPVRTSDISGNAVLVAKGLSDGLEIVTAGVHVLSPGQKVHRYVDPAAVAASAAAAATGVPVAVPVAVPAVPSAPAASAAAATSSARP